MNPQQLKAMGRNGDNTVAHLTPGEVVLPHEVAQKLKGKIEGMIGQDQMERLTVGRGTASVNPATGLEEFGVGSWVKKQVRSGTKRVRKVGRSVRKAADKAYKQATSELKNVRDDLTGLQEYKDLQAQAKKDMAAYEKRATKANKQQFLKIQKMFKQAQASIRAADKKQAAESAYLIQSQKIETLKSRRKFTAGVRAKVQGETYGVAEDTGISDPLDQEAPSYSPRKRRRKASISSRAMPTLQIGGQFRPS